MGVVLNSPGMCLPSNPAMEAVCILPRGSAPRLVADRCDDDLPGFPSAREFAPQIFHPLSAVEGGEARRARILTTVMLTDIVESTRRAVDLGDHEWSCLLDRHDDTAREVVRRYAGVLAKTTGDGVLATFDAPSCAVRCGLALQTAAKLIGLSLRVGVHTGEVELLRDDLRGVAVHTASRVMRKCRPGEVLVSRVVTDLVAGAGLTFAERGAHELRGLPGRWELFAAHP
jgi:class 3 adenylate cyclase